MFAHLGNIAEIVERMEIQTLLEQHFQKTTHQRLLQDSCYLRGGCSQLAYIHLANTATNSSKQHHSDSANLISSGTTSMKTSNYLLLIPIYLNIIRASLHLYNFNFTLNEYTNKYTINYIYCPNTKAFFSAYVMDSP